MLTPALCRLHDYNVTVYCTMCGGGRPLDLLPFMLGPHDHTPFAQLFRKPGFACETHKTRGSVFISMQGVEGALEQYVA